MFCGEDDCDSPIRNGRKNNQTMFAFIDHKGLRTIFNWWQSAENQFFIVNFKSIDSKDAAFFSHYKSCREEINGLLPQFIGGKNGYSYLQGLFYHRLYPEINEPQAGDAVVVDFIFSNDWETDDVQSAVCFLRITWRMTVKYWYVYLRKIMGKPHLCLCAKIACSCENSSYLFAKRLRIEYRECIRPKQLPW